MKYAAAATAVLVLAVACGGSSLYAHGAPADEHLCRNEKNGKVAWRSACKVGEQVADLQEADDAMVAGCEYLGDVTASSGWGGLTQGLGQSRARKSAMRRAAEKGATHLVWSRMASGWSGGNASGRAYQCETRPPA